jgi:pimeloyl-ACP methyl ester carboxylesterase
MITKMMRALSMVQLLAAVVLSGLLLACQSPHKKSDPLSASVLTDSCQSNPQHTYEVYVPAHRSADTRLPLLVAIDPHGSGFTAIQHLKEAATVYPAVLVASNLIQNDDPYYMQELNELITDVQKRFPVGKQIYLAGFSGGARMVLGYAARHPVNGVLACGAFAGPGQLVAIHCPVMGLIGMDDFNFPEMVGYILKPAKTPSNVHVGLMEASHAWPDKKRLTNMFGWFRLSAPSDAGVPKKKVNAFVEAQQARIDSLVGAGELLQAACIGRNMASVEAFDKAGSFQAMTNELTRRPAYRNELSQLTSSLQFEFNRRQVFLQSLFSKDESWWRSEISALHQKMASEPNRMKRMAYKRLSGFLGIVCYSYAKQLAGQKDIPHLSKILMIYRLAEPENKDMQHYTKVLETLKTGR